MAKATNKESAKNQKSTKENGSKADTKKKGSEKEAQPNWVMAQQQFVKESWSEFRKIQWPTPRQAANESIVVLITVVFMIALITGYDWLSNFLLSFILQK